MNPLPSPYLLCTQPPDVGAGIIVQNSTTAICGRVILYRSYEDMNLDKHLVYALIPGYTIAIIFNGILGKGSRIPADPESLRIIQDEINRMANWYLTNHLMNNESRFKRYLL